MFMVKDEYANIVNLLKVKIKTNGKNFFWFPCIAAVMLCATLAVTVVSIIHSGGKGISFYQVQDYSTSFFFGMIIAYMVMMFLYRNINDKFSVFPQTNTARFITSALINYIIAVFVGLTTLVMYLLYNAAIKILSFFYDSVYLALNFDIGFIVGGFITFLLYSFIVVAVIDLVGVILRKWKIFAAVAFISLIVAAVVNIMMFIEYAPKVLAFLVKEPSFGLFVIKALLIWVAIVAVSLVINRFTVYHKKQSRHNKMLDVVICVIIAAVITIGIPFVLFSNDGMAITSVESETVAESVDVSESVDIYFYTADEVRIDISHLPRGSDINLEITEGISIAAGGNAFIYGQNDFTAYLSGTYALNDIQGNTLLLQFRPPFYHRNDFEIVDFPNLHISAYLEGDTLYIEYSIGDAHTVIIPIWSMAGQFDIFKGKGLVLPHGFRFDGNSHANILLSVG